MPRPDEPQPAPESVDDKPLLPSTTTDDTDSGWGEERSEQDYLRERPPHHGD